MQENLKSQIAQLREKSLPRLVRQYLEHEIFSGQILPGEKINEVHIARELGVSRSPVREACRELEQGGFLVNRVQRGSFVRELTLEEVAQIYEIREGLGAQAGKLAAKRITSKQVAQFEGLLERMVKANQSGDIIAIWDLGFEFHKIMMEACGNPQLAEIYFNLHRQHRLFRLQVVGQFPSMNEEIVKMNRQSIKERREVLEAVKSGDPARAAQAYGEYAHRGRDRSMRALQAVQSLSASEGGADVA